MKGNNDRMRFLAFCLVLFTGTAMAQPPDDEWLPSRIENWTQQPDGFGGLKFGASQAVVDKEYSLEATQIDSRNIGKAYRTQMNVWGMELDVSLMFLSDQLSLVSVAYPGERFTDVKAKMIELLGPVHKAHNTLSGPMKGEDLFWYGTDVFVRLTDKAGPRSHGFFMATYEYMKDYGGDASMMRPVDPPAWVPYPADHWPQEPDGFNKMKFAETKAQTEQRGVKLTNCKTGMYDNLYCDTTLEIEGRTFSGNLCFGVKHSADGKVQGEGHLGNIYAEFDASDYPFVKAAFIRRFGEPHSTQAPFGDQPGEMLNWAGNKAMIRITVLRDKGGFVLSPNFFARGATLESSFGQITKKR